MWAIFGCGWPARTDSNQSLNVAFVGSLFIHIVCFLGAASAHPKEKARLNQPMSVLNPYGCMRSFWENGHQMARLGYDFCLLVLHFFGGVPKA